MSGPSDGHAHAGSGQRHDPAASEVGSLEPFRPRGWRNDTVSSAESPWCVPPCLVLGASGLWGANPKWSCADVATA